MFFTAQVDYGIILKIYLMFSRDIYVRLNKFIPA